MKTIIENAKNPILVESNLKCNAGIVPVTDQYDDTVLFLNDSKVSHRPNAETYLNLKNELKENGISTLLFYEYDYALNMPIRKAMVDAGFKIGDMVLIDVKSQKGNIRRNQPIQIFTL